MKIFIVYRGEFYTDKPRNYMATPEILLVTANRNKALQKIKDTKQTMSNWNCTKNIYNESKNGFEYNNDYFTYGEVGIIEEKLVQ